MTGLPKEQVAIHTMLLGGGFGRRYERAELIQAVTIARQIGRPVQVLWTREEDIRQGYYRPATAVRLTAALDAKGWPVSLSVRASTPSLLKRSFPDHFRDGKDKTSVYGLTEIVYAIGNLRVELVLTDITVPLGFMRSVSYLPNVFAVEGFIDEIATATGRDRLELRRRLLGGDQRCQHLLDIVAERSGWTTPPPAGRARGLAVHEIDGSFAAQVAEVGFDWKGAFRVYRIWAAVDCGRVIHPDIVRAQMEGGIAFGLSNALFEAITLSEGQVQESNFSDYRVLSLAEMPEVDVAIVDSTEHPTGVGEAGTAGVGAAVGNAIFALTGKRLRRMPLISQLRQA